MTAAAIVSHVRELGADFRIVDGQLRLSRASLVPAAIVSEIRTHKRAVKLVIDAQGQQIPMEFAPPPPGFWESQDARFNELLTRYGIPFEATATKKRSAAQ